MGQSEFDDDPLFTTSIEEALSEVYTKLMQDLYNIKHGEKTKLSGYLHCIYVPSCWGRLIFIYFTSVNNTTLKMEIKKSGFIRSKKIVAELTPGCITYNKYKKIREVSDFLSRIENKMVE